MLIDILIILSMLGLFIYLTLEVLSWIIEGKLLIAVFLEALNRKNNLYKCGSCKKLYREYQKELYLATNESYRCPHCEERIGAVERRVTQKKWMETHPDCPKITEKKYRELKKTMKEIETHRQESKDIEYYQEYNKVEVDLQWVKNLNK